MQVRRGTVPRSLPARRSPRLRVPNLFPGFTHRQPGRVHVIMRTTTPSLTEHVLNARASVRLEGKIKRRIRKREN